jgi:prepilin-type processing-associated H-X9-DG protein
MPIFQDRHNLRQLGIAFHNYEESYAHFPAQAICDGKGKPLLSWRVAILEYHDDSGLYKRFKLDEPWDSPHNKKLIPLMPKIYAAPGRAAAPGLTHYQVFTGPNTLFTRPDSRPRITSITDGTSATFLLAESSKAVPWTKPEDMEVTAKAMPKLGGQFKGFLHVLFCDGSVQRVKPNAPEKALRAYISPSGGEVVNDKDIRP